MKSWLKWGLILGVLSIVIGIILTLTLGMYTEGHPPIMTPSILLLFLFVIPQLGLILFLPLMPVVLYENTLGIILSLLLSLLLNFIIYFILGAIIGFIVGKIKESK
jgi:hypothetical protein